ncbi:MULTISPECIES: LLM class flavin-dependent oxidoreductase [unclassified Mycobacterium]|uniref:LLM class flavin-dependent oxidoreductase n=1 Tax=unclassified Mycobacterium TaxID=2642494 RepID=UPI0003A89FA4|nr:MULTISPECIES: LLM class flavin-dependent oxidoreductase [unclassified Mycobacterium]SEB25558.1 Luciferase-like monooxygenase [Mycobacterium sp. 283mftsu]
MHHAIFMPPLGELADPQAIIDIAIAAEESGWDGLFVWDHVLSPIGGDWEIADPWVVLAAAAANTSRIRLGPMVTPLPRRRILKLARETATLDRLSRGRLVLGLGTGDDRGREYSAVGENIDARRRGRILDEGVGVLTALWAGETVTHHGELIVEGVRAVPDGAPQPRIPLWFGTARHDGKPVERAARHDGIFPLTGDASTVAQIADTIEQLRGSREGFDIAVKTKPGTDAAEFATAGATWAMHAFWPGDRPDRVLQVIEAGRPG